MKKFLTLLFLCFFVIPAFSFAEQSPLDVVKDTVDKIIVIVEQNPTDVTTRRAKIREVIEPVFNFNEMAKLSLGNNWKEASESEQQEYVKLFSDLLATTYLKKIDQVKKDTVIFRGHRERQDQALVKTDVNFNNDLFPIVYKMRKEASGWRVHDVSIENISLVSNYRSEFAGIIRKNGIDGLLNDLRQKVNK